MASAVNLIDFYTIFTNNYNTISETKISEPFIKNHVTVYKDIRSTIHYLRIAQFNLSRQYFAVLHSILEEYQKLKILKLEFCSLQSENIVTISDILRFYSTIKELSVSGNPNEEQNFYLLLDSNSVTNLSLRFCQINKLGIKKITEQLNAENNNCSLLHINLSSNLFDEEGLKHIADMLRTNRKIVSINLADNAIDDEGCALLFEPLREFTLKHPEIVERRRRRYIYFRQKTALLKQHSLNLKKEKKTSPGVSVTKTVTKRSAGAKASARGSNSSIGKGKGGKKATSSDSDPKRMLQAIESQLPQDQHPFVSESYQKDKQVFCRGNFNFEHYNLSYNKITHEGLEVINETVKYQKEFIATGVITKGGLTHLQLVGNEFDPKHSVVKNLLMSLSKVIRTAKSSNISLRDSKKSLGSRKRSITSK